MSKNTDYSKNLSAEYYNYRNWHYNNQTRVKGVDHSFDIPYKYLVNLNIGDNNGHCK
jgi:hypothetical protein